MSIPQKDKSLALGARVPGAATEYLEPEGPAIAVRVRRQLRLVSRKDFPGEARDLLEALIEFSFDARRSAARVPDQVRLCICAATDKTGVSRALRWLEGRHLVERWTEHRESFFRVQHDATQWDVRWRVADPATRRLALDTAAWIYGRNVGAPEEAALPFPPPAPGMDEALLELSRETTLALPLTTKISPPRTLEAGHAHPGPGVPDNKQRLCRQPTIGNEPAAGAREADAPVAGFAPPPTAAGTTSATAGAGAPTTSEATESADPLPPTAETLALVNAECERLRKAVQGGHLTPAAFALEVAALRRKFGFPSRTEPAGKVGSPANSVYKTSGSELAAQPTPNAPAHVRASDVPEHLFHPDSGSEIHLTSALEHPDVGDVCSLHKEAEAEADVGHCAEMPGGYGGGLEAELIRAVGLAGWEQYLTSFWRPALACDRSGLRESLADYSLVCRRKRIGNAGGWIRRNFEATSRKWRESQR